MNKGRGWIFTLTALMMAGALSACPKNRALNPVDPAPTPMQRSVTATFTRTGTKTASPTRTISATYTISPTKTDSATITDTPSATPTSTDTPTPTPTP